MKAIYPNVKRDFDGKLTENKLTLVEEDELIGRKMPVSNDELQDEAQTREETYERKRYIRF